VDLGWSSEHERFRSAVRNWLADHLPDELRAVPYVSRIGGDDDSLFTARRVWQAAMAAAGYVGLTWPARWGGQARDLAYEVLVQEESARIGAPMAVNSAALYQLAPTLLAHGTDEQRERYLPGILDAREIWCQGFSEPDAGSDLAALRTRAVARDDALVVSGTKIWTTLAARADRMFALVRSDPSSRGSRGISFVLIDMDQLGVTVRPLSHLGGDQGFAEVVLDDAIVSDVVGARHDGWRVATTTLAHERAAMGLANYVRLRALAAELRRLTRSRGLDLIVGALLAELEAFRSLTLRSLSTIMAGAEPSTAEASITKLVWSEWYRRATDVALEVLGPEGVARWGRGARWQPTFLEARAATIYAGTSEVQRNLLAERVLGMPREARGS
jgi:alkylation response protein AidB-like acyl-CoA dehydrogenase